MKNIKIENTEKYKNNKYSIWCDGIYKKDNFYFMTLSFEQEPKYEEGKFADNISQYPLEDILDKFQVVVSDFYKKLNKKKSKICYLEFSSSDLRNIKKLRTIVGKHVYNKKKTVKGNTYVDLVIEAKK